MLFIMLYCNEFDMINNELFGDIRSYVFLAHNFGCAHFYFSSKIGVMQDDDLLNERTATITTRKKGTKNEKSNMHHYSFRNHIDMLYGGLCGNIYTQDQP